MIRTALASVAVLILLTSSVTAQPPDIWVGGPTNEWELGQNWLDGTTPTAVDDVIIVVGPPGHPIVSTFGQKARIVTIGESMLGQLDITITGGLGAERIVVGATTAAVGELNSSGVVNLFGLGDTLIVADAFGANGSFNLLGSAEWFGGSAKIGAHGTGTANLSGSSVWNLTPPRATGTLVVGDSGTAIGDVLQMGLSIVNADQVELGVANGAHGSYQLRDDGALNLSGLMRVGVNGNGILSVSGGSLGTPDDVIVGSFTTSSGTVTIADGLIAPRRLVVGDSGSSNGFVDQMGGSIFTTQDYILGAHESATGIVHQTGGTTTIGGNLLLTDISPTSATSAKYNLDGGVLDLGGGDIVFNQGTGTGTANFNYTAGIMRSVGTFGATLVQSGGTLSPGEGIGTMVIQGDFDQGAGATYEVEIDGFSQTNDLIDVQGAAMLGGDIEFVVRSRFPVLGSGMTYLQTILTATAGITESPPMVTDPHLEYPPIGHIALGLFLIDFTIVNNTVVAEYFQAVEGDTDGDSDVDITDFNTLAGAFDPTGANINDWPEADFDQNNKVDITDFNFLAANFAADGYFGPEEVIPEPPSWLLALGALVVAAAGRRHAQRRLAWDLIHRTTEVAGVVSGVGHGAVNATYRTLG